MKYLDWDAANKRLVETEYTGTYSLVTDSDTTWGTSGKTTWNVVQGNVTIGTETAHAVSE